MADTLPAPGSSNLPPCCSLSTSDGSLLAPSLCLSPSSKVGCIFRLEHSIPCVLRPVQPVDTLMTVVRVSERVPLLCKLPLPPPLPHAPSRLRTHACPVSCRCSVVCPWQGLCKVYLVSARQVPSVEVRDEDHQRGGEDEVRGRV